MGNIQGVKFEKTFSKTGAEKISNENMDAVNVSSLRPEGVVFKGNSSNGDSEEIEIIDIKNPVVDDSDSKSNIDFSDAIYQKALKNAMKDVSDKMVERIRDNHENPLTVITEEMANLQGISNDLKELTNDLKQHVKNN